MVGRTSGILGSINNVVLKIKTWQNAVCLPLLKGVFKFPIILRKIKLK